MDMGDARIAEARQNRPNRDNTPLINL